MALDDIKNCNLIDLIYILRCKVKMFSEASEYIQEHPCLLCNQLIESWLEDRFLKHVFRKISGSKAGEFRVDKPIIIFCFTIFSSRNPSQNNGVKVVYYTL